MCKRDHGCPLHLLKCVTRRQRSTSWDPGSKPCHPGSFLASESWHCGGVVGRHALRGWPRPSRVLPLWGCMDAPLQTAGGWPTTSSLSTGFPLLKQSTQGNWLIKRKGVFWIHGFRRRLVVCGPLVEVPHGEGNECVAQKTAHFVV